jgi:hypothetical protein
MPAPSTAAKDECRCTANYTVGLYRCALCGKRKPGSPAAVYPRGMPRRAAPKPPTPPRVGRPPRGGVTADKHLDIRCTEAEREEWRRVAAPQSVSEWLRDMANRAVKRSRS